MDFPFPMRKLYEGIWYKLENAIWRKLHEWWLNHFSFLYDDILFVDTICLYRAYNSETRFSNHLPRFAYLISNLAYLWSNIRKIYICICLYCQDIGFRGDFGAYWLKMRNRDSFAIKCEISRTCILFWVQ